jgi:hypothetical protein
VDRETVRITLPDGTEEAVPYGVALWSAGARGGPGRLTVDRAGAPSAPPRPAARSASPLPDLMPCLLIPRATPDLIRRPGGFHPLSTLLRTAQSTARARWCATW